MNIFILVSSLNFGGAEKQAVLDANMLSNEHTIFLGTLAGGPLEEQISDGVTLIKIKKSTYLLTAIRLSKIVRQNNIQIIHAHLFASSVISALASLITKISVIWHFHAHRFETPSKGKLALRWLSRLNKVKKLLFVNTELMEYYLSEEFGLPINKCLIMYNSTQQKPTIKQVKEANTFKIGFIGRIVELKRVEYLVELAKWLGNNNTDAFEIEIIGDGPEKENLERMAINLGVNHKVHFEGFQSDTAKYYSQFDLFVLPSREECLSIALIDAGVLGIPSIAFQVGGNNEIIQNGITGYIVKSKEELFEKVEFLLHNPVMCIQFGKKAQEFCNLTFGEATHHNALNSLYSNLIATR